MNKKIGLAVIGLVAVLGLVFMFYSSTSNVKYRVEVCVAFQGRTSCRTARADTEEHALRSAQSNACGLIASGVTDTMQCEHSNPTSVKWLQMK
ncbi:MAG TPA: hypothetical protein VGP62_17720 [Bryobacteraceae bacterium]|jgi:hypothetical protein|nr:hypothetical protein [Bryobacteraceae bacterium]